MGAWRRALEKKIPEGVKGGACRVEGIDYWSDWPNPAKTGHKRPALCERPAKCGHFRPAETSLFPRNQPKSLIGPSTIAEKRPNPAKSGHFRAAETSLFPRNQPKSLIGPSTIAEKRPNPAKCGHGDGWRVASGEQILPGADKS